MASQRIEPSPGAKPELQKQVESRFGVLPNFFRLAPETPEITEKLWAFAQIAYLDNPLPSLFKERLFVHLSRFCAVRYCIARHVGFLVGLGRPSGDARERTQSAEDAVLLLRRKFPRGGDLEPHFSFCAAYPVPLTDIPSPDSKMEDTIFVFASHVFLQTADAPACQARLERLLGAVRLQYLILFMAFVRAAHYWTETHPELVFEDDIKQLLATHEVLASCIMSDSEGVSDHVSQRLLDELPALRERGELSKRLLQSRDDERRRIARELHDDIGQQLALLSAQISQMEKGLPQGKLRSQMEALETQASQITSNIQSLSHELHSSKLEYLGLVLGMKGFCREFGGKHRATIDFDSNGVPPVVPQEVALCLFRVMQEGLRNALRHSGALTFEVKLYGSPAEIRLSVRDSGVGFEPELVRDTQGLGLISMRERVRLVNGTISITTRPQSGTEISVRVPLAAGTPTEQTKWAEA